ncbi:MAG: putative molybdenum carrier protein, partial [bacterium]|nr:putative molybdenum carrier protein [bacterium]
MRPVKIITGGQSGADLAGNVFAREIGIETEINSFAGFRPVRKEDWDLYRSFKRNNVVTTSNYIYGLRKRTVYNVIHSDATLIFVRRGLETKGGSFLTRGICLR